MVKQGSFREDLYYRLLVVPIKIPPLRERQGDVEELVQHFFVRSRTKHGQPDLTMKPEIMRHFLEYTWPGNVRELENAVERMILLARGPQLSVDDLPEFLHPGSGETEEQAFPLPTAGMTLAAIEKQVILQVLKQCGGIRRTLPAVWA